MTESEQGPLVLIVPRAVVEASRAIIAAISVRVEAQMPENQKEPFEATTHFRDSIAHFTIVVRADLSTEKTDYLKSRHLYARH